MGGVLTVSGKKVEPSADWGTPSLSKTFISFQNLYLPLTLPSTFSSSSVSSEKDHSCQRSIPVASRWLPKLSQMPREVRSLWMITESWEENTLVEASVLLLGVVSGLVGGSFHFQTGGDHFSSEHKLL